VYVLLADVVLAVHLTFLAAIPLGGILVARYPRLLWPHLACVAVALYSVTVGFDCPLTTWEQSLRRKGGQRPYRDGFVTHYLTGTVYPHGYDWAVQVLFGLCVVTSYAFIGYRRASAHRR
jgi:hypothetical protein